MVTRYTSGDKRLADDQPLYFGDDLNFSIFSDGTDLYLAPGTDDGGVFYIGNATEDCDVLWYSLNNAKTVEFNAGDAVVNFADVDIVLDDDAILTVGVGSEIVLSSDGTDGTFDGSGIINIGVTNATSLRLGRSAGTVITEGTALTTVGNGAIVANKCSTVEGGNGTIHQTTLTLTLTGDHDLDLADGDHGTGIKIYDFPAGSIQILGATCNAIVTSVNAEGGGATFPMALGSAVGADDNTLTGTEADIIPSTAIDGGATKDFHATLAAPILFANAAGTDLDLYLNAAITAAVATGAVTIAVTGQVTITWINLGDY